MVMAGHGSIKYQVYLHWANSVLCEAEQGIKGLGELQNAGALSTLIDTLWPDAKLQATTQALEDQSPDSQLQAVLDYLHKLDIKCTITTADILGDDLKPLQNLLWLIILNFTIHNPRLTSFQRNIRMGSRLMLNWCRESVKSMTVNHNESLVKNISRDGVLIDLIAAHCTDIKHDHDTVVHMGNCLEAAETQLGVNKGIIDVELLLQGKLSEGTLLTYLALLRRKVKQRENQLVPAPQVRELRGRTIPVLPSTKLAWTI